MAPRDVLNQVIRFSGATPVPIPLLEDRESQAMEVYLTRLGERGGGPDVWTADACRYVLTF